MLLNKWILPLTACLIITSCKKDITKPFIGTWLQKSPVCNPNNNECDTLIFTNTSFYSANSYPSFVKYEVTSDTKILIDGKMFEYSMVGKELNIKKLMKPDIGTERLDITAEKIK